MRDPRATAIAPQAFKVHGADWRMGVTDDGRPYAVAADIAPTFDYAKTQNALAVVSDDEKGYEIVVTPGGRQRMAVIYEDGIWELIFRSSKPEAKAIKKRVKEILRQLTTGKSVLIPRQRDMSKVDWIREALESEEARLAAEARAATAEADAMSWQTLASADGDYAVADTAKILSRDPAIDVGRNRLFTILGDLGWAFRQRGDNAWRAYQTAVDAGRLSEIPQSHYRPRTGELVLDAPQLRVTVKGLEDLRRILGGTSAITAATAA
ncbi:MAG: phage antirepressor [Stackebrandtia sp.]